jgi:hypothetical protein
MHHHIHIHVQQYVYQLMGVFCDRLKLGSTAVLDCLTGQNKDRYREKELLLLLVLLDPLNVISLVERSVNDFIESCIK